MKESVKYTKSKRARRVRRVRAVISGTAARLRLSVHISNAHFYAQGIDDTQGRTLLSCTEKDAGIPSKAHITVDDARKVGTEFAKRAQAKGITAVVFDRGHYRYHGRVKAFVDGVRDGGLNV